MRMVVVALTGVSDLVQLLYRYAPEVRERGRDLRGVR
jgi:hypothetical protein